MSEKIGHVKNPLSIIAIFSGIAELTGTVVLPLIEPDVQYIYVWFLMGFPVLLVCLFFATLNWNHVVLYAPSDYADQKDFWRLFRPASQLELIEKAREEIIVSGAVDETNSAAEAASNPAPMPSSSTGGAPSDLKALTQSAEVFNEFGVSAFGPRQAAQMKTNVLLRLAKETGGEVASNMAALDGAGYAFDGLITTKERLYIVETKYFNTSASIQTKLIFAFEKLFVAVNQLPPSVQDKVTVVLVVVVNEPLAKWSPSDRVSTVFAALPFLAPSAVSRLKFSVEVRAITLSEALSGIWFVA